MLERIAELIVRQGRMRLHSEPGQKRQQMALFGCLIRKSLSNTWFFSFGLLRKHICLAGAKHGLLTSPDGRRPDYYERHMVYLHHHMADVQITNNLGGQGQGWGSLFAVCHCLIDKCLRGDCVRAYGQKFASEHLAGHRASRFGHENGRDHIIRWKSLRPRTDGFYLLYF